MTDDYAEAETTMLFLMDTILMEYADRALEASRLGRTGVHTTRYLAFSEMLAQLEASGDAMRFVKPMVELPGRRHQTCVRYLRDLELEAQEDLEDI